MIHYLFLFPLFFVVLASPVYPQVEDPVLRLRLAQGFEQSGDWEQAVSIYEALYRESPANVLYYDGLRRGYIQLKEYEKAAALILDRLTIQKNDPVLLATLGGVYYQMGDDRRADSLWNAVLSSQGANVSAYRVVASHLMEFRLYDRAIATFLAARTATGNQILFLEELAGLYGAFQQYEKAAGEYVRMLKAQPQQLSYVQSRLSIFLNRPEALKPIQRVVQEEIREYGNFVPLRQLSAWLHMEEKNYEAALQEYRVIDRMTNASGTELFNFAQTAMVDKAYRTAAIAWKEVLEKRPSAGIVPIARFNYARALEELDAESTVVVSATDGLPQETKAGSAGIILLYEAVARDFPRTEFAARALFRIGVIRKERMFDLDGAAQAFEQVRETLPGHPVTEEATLEIALVQLMRNALDEARKEYSRLLDSRSVPTRNAARFRLAEIEYHGGNFDSAKAILGPLVQDLQTDLSNDALELLYFIEENSAASPEALREFARAELLVRQRKHSEAFERFTAITTRFPQALLVDETALRIADLHVTLGRPEKAVAVLESIVAEMPMSIHRDRALMKSGQLYEESLANPAKAIAAYEKLLTEFPNSLYAGEARQRIRVLRGDPL